MSTLLQTIKPCNLPEILARANAATPGPWFLSDLDGVVTNGVERIDIDADDDDIRFIIEARADVPAMATEIEMLRDRLAYYEQALKDEQREHRATARDSARQR
jgi:hypothetical protein